MTAQKRSLEDSSSIQKKKKLKTDADKKESKFQATAVQLEEIDFPRGGGTSFTPLEVKAIRAEAVKEADAELIKDATARKVKKRKRKDDAGASKPTKNLDRKEKIRIEHLNYKRIHVGMKIFGQITSIFPLALIVSLPNQLYAHVPITNISSQFTELLERMEAQEIQSDPDDENDEATKQPPIPGLADIFRVGQYVRAIVSAVHAPGTGDVPRIGIPKNNNFKAGMRVELSLIPERVNAGVKKCDLRPGFAITASVKSLEDHGFSLDLGVADVSGFLPYRIIEQSSSAEQKELYIGALVGVTVTQSTGKGRVCTVTADSSKFSTLCLSEISSVTSILPGTLVQGLITSINRAGLNVQVLGYFDGVVDEFHLDQESSSYKVGKKVKARILYGYSSSPPKFSLSLSQHTINLTSPLDGGTNKPIPELYPVGTILKAVKILRTEAERGIIVEVSPGVKGFVHISQVSDDRVDSLADSGPWKPGSLHPARVTGFFDFDGLLQLTLKPSIIHQKYLRASDVEAGELVKGTVKTLTDSCLFVSLWGGIDGVIWPSHYSDIILKHPAKRFKEGASIKCRVLVVEPERNRIALTAKKTLLDSDLPVISKAEDVKRDLLTYGVVFRVYEKHLMVEFYNHMKAVIPQREIGEITSPLLEAFPVGRVVKVRIVGMQEDRITASIKRASAEFDVAFDIDSIEIGHMVEGTISEIHKDNVLISLQPTRIRALLSLKNLANYRSQTVAHLRTTLEIGESLEELVVVSRNPEKAIVIVANKPKQKQSLPKNPNIKLETITIGQLVSGRVTKHIQNGALLKITPQIGGILQFTDLSDNFDSGAQLPDIDSVIKAAVVGIAESKKQLTLSTRQSRVRPDEKSEVVDREVNKLDDLEVGQTVRGFVKSTLEHGVFVTIGRDIDGRVQIKELFDEYVKDWQGHFKVHQVVKGRVLSIDTENKKVELAFRRKAPPPKQKGSVVRLSDLKEGEKIEGIVKKIEEYGLFIQINDSKLSGLCHKSQLSDNPNADVSVALQSFHEGDRVKALILKVENKRISLGLKPSQFDDEDFAETEAGNQDSESRVDEGERPGDGPPSKHQLEDKDDDVVMVSGSNESDGEMDIDLGPQQIEFNYTTSTPSRTGQVNATQSTTLSSLGGFQWSSTQADNHEDQGLLSSSSDEDGGTKPGKKKRRREIEQDLTAEMHTKKPDCNADFERLLLGSPNSSYLWIQYMSFQLPVSELDKAREIARRALKTINFREEGQRLNIWVALLNLENIYGTDETLDAVFKEAARANDSKTVHLNLASIFDESDKLDKAEKQYKRTCKKFGQSSKVWTLFGQFLLKRGQFEESRKQLPRALQSLENRKHLKTISQFALMEYRHGDPERGKTLFEGIIDSHPKRWDMWSIYMDMEGTQRNIQSLRNLFDRIFTLKMTSHKAKAFFKKWLELEKRIGDDEGVDLVKEKAIEWTQRAAS